MIPGISEEIYRELAGFCTFFLVGAALELARALLCFLLAVFGQHRVLARVLDFLYWIYAGILLLWELYGENGGVIAGYVPIGIGAGIFVMWQGFTVRVIPALSARTIRMLAGIKKWLKKRTEHTRIKLSTRKKSKD